jgi:hypothetical protein
MIETDFQAALLLLLPQRIPDLRVWRRQIMFARVDGRPMKSGIKGQADLYGYWRGGQAIEIELKSLRRITTPEQLAWEAFCKGWGVGYLRLRPLKTESVEETLERWVREIEGLRPTTPPAH